QALDQQVAKTLDEADGLIKQEKWPEALAVVERTDQLLAAAGKTERPQRLLELKEDLSVAQRLEGISRAPTRALQTQLSRSIGDGGAKAVPVPSDAFEEEVYSGRQQDAEFAKVFRDFGIDIDRLDPTEAAAQMTQRTIRSALVKALDEWAPLRKRARGENDT